MTCAVYAPSLSWGYVYEDVVHMPTPQTWREVVSRPPMTPTRWLSVTLQSAIGVATDHAPRAQRIASLGLHLWASVLLWALAHRLGLGLVGAAVATGLFLLHPAQIEAVASIAYRTDILLALCVLAAIWCAERGWGWLALAVAGLALLVKPAGVVVLGLVPVWAWWRGQWTWTAGLAWAMACGLLAWLGLAWIRGGMGVTLTWASPWEAWHTLTAWTILLLQWGIPTGLSLDPDWSRLVTGPSMGLAAALWIVGGLCAWRSRWCGLLVTWAAVLILPRLLWRLGEGLHEHHLYLMTIPLSLAMGSLFTRRQDA